MRAVGIILAGGNVKRLGDLTKDRITSAMPVGSCYRAIDFPLSNMSNSGIKKVAVMTQYNSRSLNDHLNSPRWWDFGTKHGGLFVFTPFLSENTSAIFRGTADSMYQNLTYLKRSNEKYVVIASGEAIYKFNYNEIIDYHSEKDADITIVCKEMGAMNVEDFGVVDIDEDFKITEFEEKPVKALYSTISLGIYVIKRELLIELLETAASQERYEFVNDIIVRYRRQLKMYAYMYDGYWATINSIQSYYNINMDFLRSNVRRTLFSEYPYIETKRKDEPPVKYNALPQVKNCLIGAGSIIDGNLFNSVLFRRVKVGEKASVASSIIMEGCDIGSHCTIEYAIIDKDTTISAGTVIKGEPGNLRIIKKGANL